ncbi:Zn(II)2Cys6 transcription factor [Aspergillus brunneoviolaceus CBS 621.78]|uniref:Zn(II)2Cys6 transcription factor n=1 Tax=Aspergillus brunneoviolaceus CBS 621.78 TaxID=1450534 RepID=A0ACD1GAL9_9EURO|nr:Zn(II)2Cys6 transcription factor [Aspergillus brunneoviolaceus CBS 621.78]RAH46222.1 Zn(II)2Cys6 transcription factor [Aspergillus brunneoviolaceus CBS 621.78]
MADATQGSSRGIRKPRKSRGRGLRATTGCLICKKRHVKCDEARPQCGPCAKGKRDCVYGTGTTSHPQAPGSGPITTPALAIHKPPSIEHLPVRSQVHEPLQVLVDACQHQPPAPETRPLARSASIPASPGVSTSQTLTPAFPSHQSIYLTSPPSTHDLAPSPATDSSVSSRLAPLSWFELLANDAVNADRSLVLSPAPGDHLAGAVSLTNFLPRSKRECESFQAAAFRRDPELENRLPTSTTNQQPVRPDHPSSWSTPAPIELTELEHLLFSHFVRNVSRWFDFYDPGRHTASIVPQLAVRNTGLMKALLALSARHLSIWHARKDQGRGAGFVMPGSSKSFADFPAVDRHLAVQYYYETLNYLNKAMQYPSYASSRELISTALLISTYEMVDGSNSDWERHLKGVFWIQRFQNNNGDCGGLRQAIWWIWLRQDAWVAMRQRRRLFSFWKPERPISSRTAPELACFASYLLAQCINYASQEETVSNDIQSRLERGNELLCMLQEWQDCLPAEFDPLPTVQYTDVFPPIWVHPPPYAAALQIHSLARILVISNRPPTGDFQDYRAAQKILTTAVNTICGIARTVAEDELAGGLTALQCLFGAGMSVHAPDERAALLELIDKFERLVCWPSYSLRDTVEAEYAKESLAGSVG